jgi:hypothetical protein
MNINPEEFGQVVEELYEKLGRRVRFCELAAYFEVEIEDVRRFVANHKKALDDYKPCTSPLPQNGSAATDAQHESANHRERMNAVLSPHIEVVGLHHRVRRPVQGDPELLPCPL